MRVAFLTLLLAGCGSSGLVEHPPTHTLDSIAWMHASWRAIDEGATTDEVWVPSSEHTWVGLNRTVEGGTTTHYELLRMEIYGSGVRYIAAPAGQSVTPFALTRSSSSAARFENPDHDFPNWIRYERSGRGPSSTSLIATIGGTGSDEPAATWAFRRHGDAPPLIDSGGRFCRDGSTLEVNLSPCHCAAQLFCAGFETAHGVDVHIAVTEASCDGCSEVSGTCEIPGPITHVNGRAVTENEGCVEGPVPVLTLVDF